MTHFDDWVTETAVTLEGVRSFVDDPSLVGAKFLNRYMVATTSGTTGTRGLFLLDTRSLVVAKALTFRMLSSWLTPADILGIIRGRGRIAMVIATGGHFASAAAAAALQRGPDRHSGGVFAVQTPTPDLVAQLNSPPRRGRTNSCVSQPCWAGSSGLLGAAGTGQSNVLSARVADLCTVSHTTDSSGH